MNIKKFYLIILLFILISGIVSNIWEEHKSSLYRSVYYNYDNYKLTSEQKATIKYIDNLEINDKEMEAFYKVKINETEKY